jgi:hypothetical protein
VHLDRVGVAEVVEDGRRLPPGQLGGPGVVALSLEVPGGFSGTWRLRTYAICGPAVPNLQLVVNRTAFTVADRQTAQTTCPGGTRLYGAGAGISTGQGDIYLERMAPGLTGVSVAARVPAPLARSWQDLHRERHSGLGPADRTGAGVREPADHRHLESRRDGGLRRLRIVPAPARVRGWIKPPGRGAARTR